MKGAKNGRLFEIDGTHMCMTKGMQVVDGIRPLKVAIGERRKENERHSLRTSKAPTHRGAY